MSKSISVLGHDDHSLISIPPELNQGTRELAEFSVGRTLLADCIRSLLKGVGDRSMLKPTKSKATGAINKEKRVSSCGFQCARVSSRTAASAQTRRGLTRGVSRGASIR